jgi:hypothetical protein
MEFPIYSRVNMKSHHKNSSHQKWWKDVDERHRLRIWSSRQEFNNNHQLPNNAIHSSWFIFIGYVRYAWWSHERWYDWSWWRDNRHRSGYGDAMASPWYQTNAIPYDFGGLQYPKSCNMPSVGFYADVCEHSMLPSKKQSKRLKKSMIPWQLSVSTMWINQVILLSPCVLGQQMIN